MVALKYPNAVTLKSDGKGSDFWEAVKGAGLRLPSLPSSFLANLMAEDRQDLLLWESRLDSFFHTSAHPACSPSDTAMCHTQSIFLTSVERQQMQYEAWQGRQEYHVSGQL